MNVTGVPVARETEGHESAKTSTGGTTTDQKSGTFAALLAGATSARAQSAADETPTATPDRTTQKGARGRTEAGATEADASIAAAALAAGVTAAATRATLGDPSTGDAAHHKSASDSDPKHKQSKTTGSAAIADATSAATLASAAATLVGAVVHPGEVAKEPAPTDARSEVAATATTTTAEAHVAGTGERVSASAGARQTSADDRDAANAEAATGRTTASESPTASASPIAPATVGTHGHGTSPRPEASMTSASTAGHSEAQAAGDATPTVTAPSTAAPVFAATSGAAATAKTPPHPSELPGVASQLVTVLSGLRATPAGGQSVTIALHPEGLGSVRATVTMDNDQLVVRLAPTSAAGETAIRSALPDLHSGLSDGNDRQAFVYLQSSTSGDAQQSGSGSGGGQLPGGENPTTPLPGRSSAGVAVDTGTVPIAATTTSNTSLLDLRL